MRALKRIVSIFIVLLILINSVFAQIDPNIYVGDAQNVAPTVDFSIALKKDIDLIIVTDYSGAQLNDIQSKINELKIAVSGRYNVQTHFIGADEVSKQPDKITLATQNNQVPVLNYIRNFHMRIYKTGYEQGTNGRTDWNNTYEDRTFAYEQVQLNEGQPLPPFQKSSSFTMYKSKSGEGYQGMGWARVYDEYTVYDPQNMATTVIRPDITTQMSMASYYMAMSYTLSSYSLDNSWALSSLWMQQQQNNFEAVKMDKINSLELKENSEKHVIFLTDNDSLKSYRAWGNYYPFGSIKSSNIGSFLDNNNVNVYAVTSENALDVKVNQQSASLSTAVSQDFSIRELLGKAKGEQQVYNNGQFGSVIEHIAERYSSDDSTNRIDLKIATDYTGTKLANLDNSLQTLKNDLQTKGISVNYEYFTDMPQTSTILLKSKKVSGHDGHVALLKENGDLYYYKTAYAGAQSFVNPSIITEQYPYSVDTLTQQSTAKYDSYYDEYVYVPVSMGNSFSGRAIPPILVETGVSDVFIIGSYILYLKNDTLYITGNFATNSSYPDDYRTVPISNSANIKKLFHVDRANMLYAVKNDGSLWAIGSSWQLYAIGQNNYGYVPTNIKNGLRSFSLEKVGPTYFNEKIVDVVGEDTWIAVLTDKGEVYAWGDNHYGQFGVGTSYDFGANGASTPVYWAPVKVSISGVTDIASTYGALYMISTMGMVYHSGFAGIDYEKYGTYNAIYPYNQFPMPYYINKSSYKVYKSLSYDSNRNYYYYNTYYTQYPVALYYNGNLVTGANKFTKVQERTVGSTIYATTSTVTINENPYKRQTQSSMDYYVKNYWNSYTYQDKQNRISDYQNSYNKYFDLTNRSRVMTYDAQTSPPIGYSIVTKDGDVFDNHMAYTSGLYYNNNAVATTNSLLQLYNLTSDDLRNKLNEVTDYPIQSIDVAQIESSALPSDSAKYFIYASDTQGSATKDNISNYISLSYVPDSFRQYLSTNGFINTIATPTINRDIASIQTLLNSNTGIYTSVDNIIKSINDKYNPEEEASVSYLVVNEDEIYYKGAYNDYENDPVYKEEFYYDHDPSVFENSTGLIVSNKQWTSTPITKFSKKGKYIIKYRVQDSPSLLDVFGNYRKWSNESSAIVYVHERPVALTNVSITPNGSYFNIKAVDGGSYDNDHLSRADKGIVAHEWRWKESTEASWHNEQINITNAVMNKVYYIEHRVQDLEGAWSNWDSMTIDNKKPPTAQYTVAKNPITTLDALMLKDTSVAYFSSIIRWQWVVKNLNTGAIIQNAQFTNSNAGTGAMAGYDVNVKRNYADVGPGTYRIYLRVKGSNGLWSDGGTDALTGYNLANSYYRDIVVKDPLKIESATIEGYWNHWRGQKDMFGKQLTNEPHRFLSLESVKINIRTSGYADKVVIRFSPELEAMQFTDKYGHIYDYKEQVGYYVNFPGDSTIALDSSIDVNNIYWEYILPLAPSTKSWDDQRVRSQYSMTVTAWKGTNSVTYTIDDIDITGNTFDLIYMQPLD